MILMPSFHPKAFTEFDAISKTHPREAARALVRLIRVKSFGLRETGGAFGDLFQRPDLYVFDWNPVACFYVSRGPDQGITETTMILALNYPGGPAFSGYLQTVNQRRAQIGV